ncbi:MAG TPA: nucleotide exchange factor GrpE [Candidatus Binataceae bacterium]
MSKRHKDHPFGHPGSPHDGADADERAIGDIAEPHGDHTGSAAGGDVEALKAALAEKERELVEFKDKYLRTLAESENARKRIRQQSEESVRIQRESLLRDLLPIIDNLERAVAAARSGGGEHSIVEGVEMVLRSLLDFLRANGVTPVAAVGQPFDPSRHEAVDHVESEVHLPNTVVNEFHRGYLIGDRVLRPARVSVSKDASNGNQTDGQGSIAGSEKPRGE